MSSSLAAASRVAPAFAPRRSRRSASRIAVVPRASAEPGSKGKLLVLGGTGFVGSKVCELALEAGYDVVSVSRRGTPPGGAVGALANVEWRAGDATRPETARDVLAEPGFVGCVHAVGMLLASDLNAIASGSGSKPAPGATYDDITRVTASYAADAAAAALPRGANDAPPPFVFVSAAEARWDFRAPVDWLEDYLVAKRAVERKLEDMNAAKALRASWLRPSLVYTMDKPAALPAVAAFALGNAVGIPFVDRPVTVDVLARAAVRALDDDSRASGALDFRQMERLAAE